jgi:hypothetical protein
MLLTVFGVPTAAAFRGFQIVQAFFTEVVGGFDLLTAATVEELRSAWAGRVHQHVLYFSEAPGADVVSFFRQAQAPMLVFVDDPVEIALALQVERGLDQIQATRAASVSASVLEEIWVAPDVMLINAGRHGTLSLADFVNSLATFLTLPCSDEQVVKVAELLRQQEFGEVDAHEPWVRSASKQDAATDRRGTSAEELVALHRFLGSYRSVVLQQPLNVVIWPGEIFVSVDHGWTGLNGMLDMTGRQRQLIDGPWFGLPRGRWQATIEFVVLDNFMGCVMQVHVVAQRVLRQGRIALPETGSHSCSLVFDHEDAHTPLVIQFTLDRGVLQGRFRLSRVVLQRLSLRLDRRMAG